MKVKDIRSDIKMHSFVVSIIVPGLTEIGL